MDVCFIHGAGDIAETNARADALDQYIPGLKRLSYWSDEEYGVTLKSLLSQARNAGPASVFIGESFGGFWAAQIARALSCRCYLMNPVVFPATQMMQFADAVLQPGRPSMVNSVIRAYAAAPDPRGSLTGRVGVMLGRNDDTIDPYVTAAYYGDNAAIDWTNDSHAIALPDSFTLIANRVGALFW